MVKSAERVMRILSLVGKTKLGLKHQEIANQLTIPKGSLSLLLADLVDGGFLSLNPLDKIYRIGPQVLALAGRFLADMDIVEVSQPVVRSVINMTGESCGVGVRNGYQVIIVWRENSDEPLKWDLKIGDQYLMHGSAFGKAILAHCDENEVEDYIRQVGLTSITKNTITAKQVFYQELASVRSAGIAFSREESFLGMISIGVPVFDHTGKVAASLSVPIPVMRFNDDKAKVVGAALRDAATVLSKELGYI